jgi:hypothetical protein
MFLATDRKLAVIHSIRFIKSASKAMILPYTTNDIDADIIDIIMYFVMGGIVHDSILSFRAKYTWIIVQRHDSQ